MSAPILAEIATTLAGKAAGSLYDLVRHKFASRKDAAAALDAARGAAADSPEVGALARKLAAAEAHDPRFGQRLREEWAAVRSAASDDGVVNSVSGTVHGNVVQARTIHGDITFGG